MLARGLCQHHLRALFARSFATSQSFMSQEWLCIIPDKPDSLRQRQETRPKHLQSIEKSIKGGILEFGGAILDGVDGNPTGSVVTVRATTKEDLVAFLTTDPYSEQDVWDLSKAQFHPFKTAVRVAKELK